MSVKKYIVSLSEEERRVLHDIIAKGGPGGQKIKRARALLLAEGGYADDTVAEKACMSRCGVAQLRQRFAEDGFELTLRGKPRGHRPKKLGGAEEARLIALTRSQKPEGKARWSLRLLRDTWNSLPLPDKKSISYETIRRAIKKTR